MALKDARLLPYQELGFHLSVSISSASSWGWPRLGAIIILLSLYVLGLSYRFFFCLVIYPLTRVSHGGFIF